MESRNIKITSVINPNKFYFKLAESIPTNLIEDLELKIQKSLEEVGNKRVDKITEGEIYAFHLKKWDRWVRVRIDKTMIQNHRPHIIMWLIDYGFPYKSDLILRLSTIDKEFKTDLNIIHCGCVDVLPAIIYFDHEFNENKLKFVHEWSQVAIDFMDNFLSNAFHLTFRKYGSKENVDFGDIIATDNVKETFSLKKMLVAQKFALSCPPGKFVENLQNVDLKPSQLTRKNDQDFQNIPSVLDKKNELVAGPDYIKKFTAFDFYKLYNKITTSNEIPTVKTESVEVEDSNNEPNLMLEPTNTINPNAIFIPAGICLKDIQERLQQKAQKLQIKQEKPSTSNMPQKEVKSTLPEPIKLHPIVIQPQSIPTTSQTPTIEHQSIALKPQISKIIHKAEREVEINLKNINLDKAIVCASDVHRVLVHGNYLSKPIDKIEEVNFSENIYKSMKAMNFKVFRIQAYSWRHILAGRSMVIVNAETSGQTFSYLPAILNTVADDCEYIVDGPMCGPSCVIIVRSSREVESLYSISKKLLSINSPVKILKAFGNNDENTVVHLINGCDIFITTPPCFDRLNTTSYVNLFDLKRIKYLIFDGLDSMLKLWQTEVSLIIKKCTRGTKHPEENPQIIVTSNVWQHQIKAFVSLSCQPVVCIGNYIEAAVYAGSKFALEKCVTIEEKALKLCCRLKDESYKYRRTMVIVNTQTEIVQLIKYLQSYSINFSTVDEISTREDIASKNTTWGCEVTGKFSLMIVIDTVLPQITLNSVQYLYHFSLPSTWTMFSYRFTVSYDYYLKLLDTKDENPDHLPCSTILLDDENLNEIPRLIDFLSTHRLADIPKNILELVEKICYERERKKRDIKSGNFAKLCPKIFQFGDCQKQISCIYRHVFTEEDHAGLHLPHTGKIKFQLVDTMNPSIYKIRILEHLPDNSNIWISRQKELDYGEESIKSMQTYYAEKENHIMRHPVKVDDLCAVFDGQDVAWHRCIVTEKKQECLNYFFASVLLIDVGRTINVKSTNLMKLPRKFLQFAPQVTDLQVLSLVPNYFEDYWHQAITEDLKTTFAKQPKNSHCVCRIEMAIRNTLFTDNFEIKIELPGVGIDISNYDLKKDLVTRKQCSMDQIIVTKLKRLATVCGLVVPVIPEVIPPVEILPKIEIPIESKSVEKWKNLRWKTDYEVIIKDFNNPEDFFVVLGDPKKKIEEISDFDAKDNLVNVVVGAVCLAKDKNGSMKRVKVMKQVEDESLVECFLVDFGETLSYEKDELFEIPAHLVEFLPFQAINCRLIGVCPLYKMDTWTKSSINAIYKRLTAGAEILKMHVVKNNEKHLKDKLLQINSYDVMLFDPENSQRFDELLIDLRFAVPDEVASQLKVKDLTEELWSDDDCDKKDLINSKVETKSDSIDFLRTFNLEDFDCQIDESEIMTMLGFKGAKVVVEDKGKLTYPLQKIQEEAITSTDVPKVIVDKVNEIPIDPVDNQQLLNCPPALTCPLKHPKIEWRQNDVLVYLTISAVDCKNYLLKISPESMSIIIKYEDTLESAIVYFFGCLDASLSSHELSGLNITVRLAKKLVGTSWPRLTQHPGKNHVIKYCTNEITLLPIKSQISGTLKGKTMYRPDDSDYDEYSSESSHDDEDFKDKLLEEPLS